jgi:nicotinamide-nucleotide amidase
MRVEVVTIGDELLLGFTIDTNAAYISRVLAAQGINVVRRTTVADDHSAIVSAVGDALERSGAVITTGGLGPTNDDLTKPSIAKLFSKAMRENPDVVRALEERWKSLGRTGPLPKSNYTQAMLPEGAAVLTNRHGTAPGIWLQDEQGRWVAMLPGVPREMRGMLDELLVPRLRELRGGTPTVTLSRTLRTTGIAESALADRIDAATIDLKGAGLAYLPGPDGVDLRITVRDLHETDAEALAGRVAAKLKPILGTYMYAEGTTDLPAVVLEMCRSRALRIAVAESCTGGMLGERLTSVAGSSDVFLGGLISYANDAKVSMLDVDPAAIADAGAVSEPVVRQMARGARLRFKSDLALAITGVAGPGGGTAEKPVGFVWIGLDGLGDSEARSFRLIGDREEIRRRATQAALDMVRTKLTS